VIGESLCFVESVADELSEYKGRDGSDCREVLESIRGFEYRGEASFRNWLFTMVLRKLADPQEFYQALKRDVRRELPMVDGAGGHADILARYRSFTSPSAHAAAGETLERIERAFARLSEDHRNVIIQAKIVGLSRAEIAGLTGKSEVAVRALLFRALSALAALLDEPEAPGRS
jgi:RNA polymerase sigma factor (sigma-70 family)